MNNDLSLADDNSALMNVEFEYMRQKQVTVKCTMSTTPKTSIHFELASPFEKFETLKYSLVYEGTPQNWKENTEFEFYYGKVSSPDFFIRLTYRIQMYYTSNLPHTGVTMLECGIIHTHASLCAGDDH